MITLESQTSHSVVLLNILHILLLIGGVHSALEEFPNNVVKRYGDGNSTFKCKSDHAYELNWFIQPNGTQRQNLANGTAISKQATSYCKIQNEEGGEFTLILKIQDESAQTYTCFEAPTNEERSAELIIIEPTRFEKGMNKSHVTLVCSVNFRGNWAPELELSHNGRSVVKGIDTSVVPNQKVSTSLVIPRNDSARAGNYSCTTRFDIRGKPKQTTDKTVPNYSEESTLTVHVEEIIHPNTSSDVNSSELDKMLLLPLLPLALLLLALVTLLMFRINHAKRLTKSKNSKTQCKDGTSGEPVMNISVFDR